MTNDNNSLFAWLILIALTLLSYGLSFFDAGSYIPILVLMSFSMIKGVLIMREFMELKGVALLWRVMMYGWLIAVCGSITLAFLIA